MSAMEMVTVPLSVPKGLIPYIEDGDQRQSFARNAMMLYPYIQDFRISHGKAAEILGVHKFDLIDFYCSMGLPYLNQTPAELEEELAEFRRFRRGNPV